MTAGDLGAVLKGIAPVVREFIAGSVEGLTKRLEALEARPIIHGKDGERGPAGQMGDRGPIGEPGQKGLDGIGKDGRDGTDGKDGGPGRDGQDADPLVVAAALKEGLSELVASEVLKALGNLDMVVKAHVATALEAVHPVPGQDGRDGVDGKSVSVEDISPLIAAEVTKAVSALPVPKDGQSVDPAEVHKMIATAVAEWPRPQDGINGKDGTSVAVSDVAPVIASEVEKAVAALPKAKDGVDGTSVGVADVEPLITAEIKKAVDALPPAKDGKSVDPAEVDVLVASYVQKAVAALPVPKDGSSVTVADVAPIISAEVTKAVASLPLPKDGKSVDPLEVDALVAKYVEPLAKDVEQAVSAIPGAIAAMVQHDVTSAVAAIPPAKDGAAGQSVDMAEVNALVEARVQKAVASLPVPKDGSSVTLADVAPVIASEVERAVAAVPRAKDGVGLAGAVIDREGRLVLTLSDGGVKELGQVVGRSVDMAEVKGAIAHEVAQIPRPKDGKDGVDGFSFDDYEEVSDGERTITRRFTHGDRVKEFTHKLPAVIYRGVWSEGKTYERGDSVTFGGHTWIAKDDTAVKPDFTPASAKCWTLSVKAGRDGREGKPGPEGPKGSKGDPGSGYK